MDFNTNANANFGRLTCNLADGSAVGRLDGVNSLTSDGNEIKTHVNGGQDVTIENFTNGDSKSVISLGDNSSVLTGLSATSGGLDFTAGDYFVNDGGIWNFDLAQGDSSSTLGLNADMSGQTISMGATGPNYSITAGAGSRLGDLLWVAAAATRPSFSAKTLRSRAF
jgi:hypothetical protein